MDEKFRKQICIHHDWYKYLEIVEELEFHVAYH